MKQITLKQAESLAFADKGELEREVRYCQGDWLRDNARYVAGIESRYYDKTLAGEWPKGWKAEMNRAANEKARADILARFLRDHCKQLDGAIWLGSWHLIEQMEGRKA